MNLFEGSKVFREFITDTEFEYYEVIEDDAKEDVAMFIESKKGKTILQYEDYEVIEDDAKEDVAMFIESKKGKTILQYEDYRYRKAYRTKNGVRWTCSSKKNCSAFVYLNDEHEILMASRKHDHPPPGTREQTVNTGKTHVDTAVIITSRKGKEMLLFRTFTYRKQYETANKVRWVCSTKKNCHASVFTDVHNLITSALEDHNHAPPKYYLDPKHVLGAIREPLFLESD